MLPLEELLGDDAREATEEVPLAVDNDNLRWRVGGEGAAVSDDAGRGNQSHDMGRSRGGSARAAATTPLASRSRRGITSRAVARLLRASRGGTVARDRGVRRTPPGLPA